MLKQKKTSTDCESIHTACATETEHPSLLQIIQLAGSSFQVLGCEDPDGLFPQLASNPNLIQYLQLKPLCLIYRITNIINQVPTAKNHPKKTAILWAP